MKLAHDKILNALENLLLSLSDEELQLLEFAKKQAAEKKEFGLKLDHDAEFYFEDLSRWIKHYSDQEKE